MGSPANRLLASLSSAEYDRLAPELETVELRRRQPVWTLGDPLLHVYFPDSGAVAMVMTTADGCLLDTGILGREGLVGIEAFLGAPTAHLRGVVVLPGVAQRMTADAFRRASAPGAALHEIVRRYACAQFVAIARSAVCDANHSIRHRCVRRLLWLQDCARADRFPLTQQALAALLGVRRASVSVAAEGLQAAGLIVYEHGRMCVSNRAGLEEAACGCYRQMKQEVEALFSQAGRPGPEGVEAVQPLA